MSFTSVCDRLVEIQIVKTIAFAQTSRRSLCYMKGATIQSLLKCNKKAFQYDVYHPRVDRKWVAVGGGGSGAVRNIMAS